MSSLPTSSCGPYDTFVALKADHSLRLPACLNSLIQSITIPVLDIHASIVAGKAQAHRSSVNTSSFPTQTFLDVDPEETVMDAIGQLLNLLKLLDADILQPMHKLSISVKEIQRRIRLLQHGCKATSSTMELQRLCEILKQSIVLVRALRRNLPSFRRILKRFIYWTDNELMATLASSKQIILGHLDVELEGSNPGPRAKDLKADEQFMGLIDRCVDIVHSSWLLTGRLRRMQRRFHALTQPLESLAFACGSTNANSLTSKAAGHRTRAFTQRPKSIENLFESFLRPLAQFSTINNPACSITIQNLITQLENIQ
ncbi:hypothetical protein CROQUDRAFT_654275 [Cronartium quercuum f. sp. fusiforme G11]|uniref:Uncharacterized protein n=1 Tax=Cronartium quercuum f. sp. fusiforme G11 TaxID=708437 RepID=A0A9P6NMU8_9BASI|nr:hypothetical protein CROQUDRAFT_654275 [Cronartium quercuum f. sp. fusiforme G11]